MSECGRPAHRPEYGDVPGWAVPTTDPRSVTALQPADIGAMPRRIWVRRVDSILGPFEVAAVGDPEGLATIEDGWHEYVRREVQR